MKKITAIFAIVALLSFASPALAHGGHHGSSDDVTVTNHNSASVTNTVNVSASTGGNDANGGTGSAAGNGGDVNHSDDNNTGGNGGNGGNGGEGGVIYTGNAYAMSLIENDVNYNEIEVDVDCDCEGDVDDVTVTNHNSASVGNNVDVRARTGHNEANGGDAGCDCVGGGDGGNVNHSEDHNAGGNGGNAGHGGWGGYINTGDAEAGSGIVNLVNTNITRIRR